jgi:hypothetical protein
MLCPWLGQDQAHAAVPGCHFFNTFFFLCFFFFCLFSKRLGPQKVPDKAFLRAQKDPDGLGESDSDSDNIELSGLR